jgi:hypothetical protein
VHPLPAPIEALLEISLHCPTVCPAKLAPYIVAKVQAAPPPPPKGAMALLHFVHLQLKQVCALRRPRPSVEHRIADLCLPAWTLSSGQ